jgi:hypothetical protein
MIGIQFRSRDQRDAIRGLSPIAALVISLLLFGCGRSEGSRPEQDQTPEAGDLHPLALGDSIRILRTIRGKTYELRSIREWCESLDTDSVLAALAPDRSYPMTPGQREHYLRSCMLKEARSTEPGLLVVGIPSGMQLIERDPLLRGTVAGGTGLSAATVLHKTHDMTFVDYETFSRRFSVSEEMRPLVARAMQRIMKKPSTRTGLVFVASLGTAVAALEATGGISRAPATNGERGARSNTEIEPFRYVFVGDEPGGAPVSNSGQD